jgi:replicative DNA helicase
MNKIPINKTIIGFYKQIQSISKEQKPTVQNIVDAVKATGLETSDGFADFLKDYCENQNIDFKDPAFTNIYKKTKEFKEKQKDQTIKEAIKNARDQITEQTKTEELNTIVEQLKTKFSEAEKSTEVYCTYTPTQFDEECNRYEDDNNFTPALFGVKVMFPEGTLSYIGARTGRGKTNSLVNLAREAICKKRKTIFISLEMSCLQILNKLVLSLTYHDADPKDKELLEGIKNPARTLYLLRKNKDKDEAVVEYKNTKLYKSYCKFKELATKAFEEQIAKKMKEEKFLLWDARGAGEPQIMNFIKLKTDAGTLVLLDYVQKVPSKARGYKDTYLKVQEASSDLQKMAGSTNSIIISAAQFVRQNRSQDGKPKRRDYFSEESFRECGDIEQDAHNAIGIGWKEDKETRFYEVLKTREGSEQGKSYEINFNGKYSYMEQGDGIKGTYKKKIDDDYEW